MQRKQCCTATVCPTWQLSPSYITKYKYRDQDEYKYKYKYKYNAKKMVLHSNSVPDLAALSFLCYKIQIQIEEEKIQIQIQILFNIKTKNGVAQQQCARLGSSPSPLGLHQARARTSSQTIYQQFNPKAVTSKMSIYYWSCIKGYETFFVWNVF